MKKPLKIVLISIASLLGLVIAFVGGFIIFASATSLKVVDHEVLNTSGEHSKELKLNEEIISSTGALRTVSCRPQCAPVF